MLFLCPSLILSVVTFVDGDSKETFKASELSYNTSDLVNQSLSSSQLNNSVAHGNGSRVARDAKAQTTASDSRKEFCDNVTGECSPLAKGQMFLKDYMNINKTQYVTLLMFIVLGMCMGLLLAKFLGDEE